MNRYTLAVTSPEYWSEIHDALIVDSNKDGIPDRKITCSDCKEHSPTRGTYELTEEEATEIGKHPHVKWIELSPIDNPGYYPNPQPFTKRFLNDVKIYRTLSGSGNVPPTSPTSAEENRTNWAVQRVGVDTHGDAWPGDAPYAISPKTGNIDYSLTGKNVDVIIIDSGILAAHPEFLDANGKSRVRDIVLDGPYYIDKSYFDTNNHTYTRPDGRVAISTTSAHAWWENSSSRSGTFSSIGTIAINSNYTEAKSIGVGGTIHSITDTHGTMVASLAGGKNFGLAFECNLWNMSAIADPTGTGVETAYDLMKLFHQNKPINSATGRKNPTLVNGSWGYIAGMTSGGTVNYKFRGDTGSFTGNDGFDTSTTSANLVKAMKEGFLARTGVYKAWSSSSRSNSTDTAGDELMASGVIHVCAAGNDNQRLGIGADDPHRLDYLSDTFYSTTDPRSEFPSGTVPCGHRDWMNPSGIGFDSATDFHPTICVGAMDDNIDDGYQEYPTYYSNNGPGIDVWAPADDTLAAGMKASDGTLLSSNDTIYNRYNSDFKDQYMNGTSAASPVTAGLVALHLESVPSATSREVKKFLDEQGSVHVGNDLFVTLDPNTGIGTTSYWYNPFNLRGARRRILRDKSASSTIPSITGIAGASVTGISFKQS